MYIKLILKYAILSRIVTIKIFSGLKNLSWILISFDLVRITPKEMEKAGICSFFFAYERNNPKVYWFSAYLDTFSKGFYMHISYAHFSM